MEPEIFEIETSKLKSHSRKLFWKFQIADFDYADADFAFEEFNLEAEIFEIEPSKLK